ncbi:MAG: bifunctional 2-polyprenyl-6-hydroxyphenol methylase/3-demethylubiquinol 3-O-methyltransferase UbiG [Pseudomonadota bacterium]
MNDQNEQSDVNHADHQKASGPSVDPEEVEKFSKISAEWWDPFGKFKPLHKFNPTRLGYIRDGICAHFQRDRRETKPLMDITLLDVGCGGGLISEPMARLGATVTGLDASERNIAVARYHAQQGGLEINYRCETVETLGARDQTKFDVVLNLEAVEHVADPDLFLSESARLVAPGGLMIVSTINKTLKAFALAKVGAEYVLGWLPRGTHDPKKFLKPSEIEKPLEAAGLSVTGKAGVAYNPFLDAWRIVEDTDVNYMVVAMRPRASEF